MSRPTWITLSAAMLVVFNTPGMAELVDGTPGPATDQEPPARISPAVGRPSIGLVLSGGGARGGAHIGVLKALEELRIPVDYIAGTSIGAIVGSFYASGMPLEDVADVPRSIDLERALLNVTPRPYRSFRRKRDDDLFLVEARPGFSDQLELELPIGLVHGQVIDTILTRLTLRATGAHDFDDLAIPFRAVAADIVTGEAVVLADGNLARAVRASMSLPAALTPLEIDGRLLVDGGIAMNLPVEVAIDMGADIIIAVDISTPMREREDMRSILDVTFQLSNLLTRTGLDPQKQRLREQDILLVPEFAAEHSTVSYARMADTIDTGYQMVLDRQDDFVHLSLPEDEYQVWQSERERAVMDPPPVVDFLRISNNSRIADSVIESRLKDIEPGQVLSIDAVERAIGKVYGLDFFQNVRYDVDTVDGQTGVHVSVDERSWGPNYLQLGLKFRASGDDSVLFGLAVSYLRTAINELGAEWRTSVKIGDEPAVATSVYQPLGASARFFVSPTLSFGSTQLSIWGEQRPLATVRLREAIFEFAAGRELEHFGEIRTGLRRSYGDRRVRVGDPLLGGEDEFRRGEAFVRFSVDTLDSIAFPRSGVLAITEWLGSRQRRLSADEDFDQWRVRTFHARTWGRHTLLTSFRYDITPRGTAPLQSLARLGGFMDLSGLNHHQLAGQNAMRLGLSYYRRIGDLALFPAFAGVSIETGNVWDSRRDMSLTDTVTGGSLWAGVDTPVGPIYVGYGRATGRRDAFYVFLGNIF